ncbi:hypothetical protein GCM10011419_30000 [Vogesella fluminis]|uniref:Uncharacterized protein n=1 Tax=Vogesella fluminis TaxID=1069161 RepID=A0ABQ3HFZ7_9NEIS|nr:hypothetical protein GCM10011419_30000 [Vogesella fluminis]
MASCLPLGYQYTTTHDALPVTMKNAIDDAKHMTNVTNFLLLNQLVEISITPRSIINAI